MNITFKVKKDHLPSLQSQHIFRSLQSQSFHRLRSQKNHRKYQSKDPLEQFTYQLQMKNRARDFIAKLKKEKEVNNGRYLITKKLQQQKHLQSIQRELNDSLQRINIQRKRKRDQIQAKLRLRRQKSNHKPAIKPIKNISQMQQQKAVTKAKGTTQRVKAIKTEPDQILIQPKRTPSYKNRDQILINSIKRKLQQLNQLSQF